MAKTLHQLSSWTFDTAFDEAEAILWDDEHILVAYEGVAGDGHVSFLNFVSNEVTSTLEFDTAFGGGNSLCKIDSTHFAIASKGGGSDGFIRTFSIDASYTITELDELEHDFSNGTYNSLVLMDSTHLLLAYAGSGNDGFIKTFAIDGSYQLSQIASLEHDTSTGVFNALTKIDETHYALSYASSASAGRLKIFTIDGSYGISQTDNDLIGSTLVSSNTLLTVDGSTILNLYQDGSNAYARTTALDGSYQTSTIDTEIFEAGNIQQVHGCMLDASTVATAYRNVSDGHVEILSIDGNYNVSQATSIPIDGSNNELNFTTVKISDSRFAVLYFNTDYSAVNQATIKVYGYFEPAVNTTYTPLYTSACNDLSDFNSTVAQGTGQSIGVVAGAGYHGDGIELVLNSTEANEVGFRVEFNNGLARRLQFWLKIDAASVAGQSRLIHSWDYGVGGAYSGGDFIQIDAMPNGSNWNLRLYHIDTLGLDDGTTLLEVGVWYRVSVSVTDSAIEVFLGNNRSPECSLSGTYTGESFGATHFGKFYTTGISGNLHIDNVAFYEESTRIQTTTTPWQVGGTATSVDIFGGTAWNNLSDATANNGSFSLVTETGASLGSVSEGIKVTDFGFNIPDGSIIIGVEMRVRRYFSPSGAALVKDYNDAGGTEYPRLVVDDTYNVNSAGSNIGSPGWSNGTARLDSFGDEKNLWNYDHIDVSQVNDTDFGVVVLPVVESPPFPGGSATMYVDYVEMRVTYDSSTREERLEDTYQGWLERFLTFEGGIVRPDADGVSGDSDIVSEGVAYGLNLAAQYDDQETFDLIEEFCYSTLERRNHPSDTTIQTNGPHLMGFLYRNKTDSFADWNYAPDADYDRAIALLWAHHRWGSAGAINYQARARDIGADLIVASEVWDNKRYGVSNYFELGQSTIEMNPSYLHPIAFRMLDEDQANTDYDELLEGSYDYLDKASDNTGALSGPNGLFPNWGGFVVATGADALTPNSRSNSTRYAYEAFRTPWRLYLDKLFYGESRATTLLGNIKTFFDSEYSGGTGTINAEYELDGTKPATYEKTGFYATAVLSFESDGDTTDRDHILTNKIDPTYTQHPAGSFWSDNPNTPASGECDYFDFSWTQLGLMALEGVFVNYGQATAGTEHTITINETLTLTTVITKQVSKSIADTVNTTDTVTQTVSANKTISETLELTESLQKQVGKAISETISLSDTIQKQIEKVLTDALGVTDSVVSDISFTQSVTDAVTVTDELQKEISKAMADSITLSDSVQKQIQKSLIESIVMSDSVQKQIDKSIFDSVNTTDNTSSNLTLTQTLNDLVNVTESVSKAITKLINDSVTGNDGLAKQVSKLVADSVGVSDSVTSSTDLLQSIAETVTVSDVISKEFAKSIAESVALTESIDTGVAFIQSIGESVAVNEGLSKQIQKYIIDSAGVTDNLSTEISIVTNIDDLVTIQESLGKQISKTLSEALSIAEEVSPVTSQSLSISDSVLLSESIAKETEKFIAETLGLDTDVQIRVDRIGGSVKGYILKSDISGGRLPNTITGEKLEQKITGRKHE